MEKVSLKEDVEHIPIQIFPDPLESVDECCRRIKGRLPSIVVELTDTGEVESGELRWPPEDFSPCEDVDNFFEVGTQPDDPNESNPEPGGSSPQGDEETEEGTAEAESDDGSRPATLPRDRQGAGRQN